MLVRFFSIGYTVRQGRSTVFCKSPGGLAEYDHGIHQRGTGIQVCHHSKPLKATDNRTQTRSERLDVEEELNGPALIRHLLPIKAGRRYQMPLSEVSDNPALGLPV
jgi:hypothetical protein